MSLAGKVEVGNEESISLWKDQRWALAQRIAHSSALARSDQLSKLLLYVCRMAIAGRDEEISEHRIGIDVFGRSPNYDPTVDGIVRSHATRLRRRLELYFLKEGAQEPLRIEIPRGGYVPHFLARRTEENRSAVYRVAETAPVPLPPPVAMPVPSSARWFRRGWTPFLAGLLLAAAAVAVILHLRRDAAVAAIRQKPAQTEIEKKFWSTLFPASGKTLIVSGDSGLVLFETETNREVTLDDYISGAYRNPLLVKPSRPDVSKELILGLASRRYTSMVDLEMVSQLTHLPEWTPDRVETVFARDVAPAEAQSANLVLLGSKQANPWISLIDPSMNFVLAPTGNGQFEFVNRHPHPGEQRTYTSEEIEGNLGTHVVYGDVAYMPNPGGQGMILSLSGLWMSGTQSAGKFVLKSPKFLAFLRSIVRPDGTFPPFELLIETKNLEGSSTGSSVLSQRVEGR